MAPVTWDEILNRNVFFVEWWKSLCQVNIDLTFRDRMKVSVYLLWAIWKARCAWSFDGLTWSAHEVVQKAVAEWCEFKAIKEKDELRHGNRIADQPQPVLNSGDLPEELRITMAFKRQEIGGQVGVGWTIKNAQDRFS